MKIKNHYVPKLYLKNFATKDGEAFAYRTLVSDHRTRLWKRSHISSLAYREYLYVTHSDGKETDELERWLDSEFESPAKRPLQKAINEERLTRDDWKSLIRFAVSLDVRTPAHFKESVTRWSVELESFIQESLSRSIARAESGERRQGPISLDTTHFPSRVRIEPGADGEQIRIEASILAGRSLWHWQIRRSLTETIKQISTDGWTILRAPGNVAFFTSDNPVTKLNFWNEKEYTFGGGWANPGTDIFLPLSPKHILYTQIGKRVPPRGKIIESRLCSLMQQFIAEHADNMIISPEPKEEILKLRPRIADQSQYDSECNFWKAWGLTQTEAERKFESGKGRENKPEPQSR